MSAMVDEFSGDSLAYLVWAQEYELGNDQIDAEHRELFELVNRLALAVARHEQWEVSAELVTQLAYETRRHFDQEEKMMWAASYPGLQRHHEQHTELLSQIDHLRDRLQIDHYLARPHKTLRFLQDWFSIHIARSDRAFVEFLKANSPS